MSDRDRDMEKRVRQASGGEPEAPARAGEEIEQHPDTGPGTDADEGADRSPRIGPSQTTGVGEHLEGAPTEDSPAREPTEKVERMEDASTEEEVVEREP